MQAPNHILIYIDQQGFKLILVRWWQQRQMQAGKLDELFVTLQGLEQVGIRDCMIDIVIESDDELYIQEYLPKLSRQDTQTLLNKKIQQHFAKADFFATQRMGVRDKKIHLCLFGLEHYEVLKQQIDLIIQNQYLLRGFYLSSQITTAFFIQHQRSSRSAHLIIEQVEQNTIRKTCVLDGKLVFSHSSPYSGALLHDIRDSLSYYQQLNLLAAKQSWSIWQINQQHQLSAIQLDNLEAQHTLSTSQTPNTPEWDRLRLCFIKQQLGRRHPKKNLLTAAQRREVTVFKMKWVVLLISMLASIAFMIYLMQMHVQKKIISQQSHALANKIQTLHRQYIAQQQQIPITTEGLEKIHALISLDQALIKAKKTPIPVIYFLNQVFTEVPEITLDRLRWIASSNALYPDEDSNPIKHTTQQGHKQLFDVMYLEGHLDDQAASLMVSEKIFDYFLLAIQQHEQVYQIEILQHPVKNPHYQTIAMRPEHIQQAKQFKLRISFWSLDE